MARLGDRDPASDAEERRARVLLDPLPHDAAQPPWVDPEEQAFPVPLFVVAVCTRSAEWAGRLEERLGLESVLQDPRQILLGDYFDTLEGLALRDRQIEEFAAHAEALQARIRVTDERIASLELHARNLEELRADQSADLAAWRTCAATLEAGVVEHEEFYRQLSSHARALEEWTGGLQRHAQHLEQVVSQLRAHVINLEQRLQERCERVASLEAHASHLEPTVSGLRGHAENLEAALERRDERIVELETHAQNLERVLAERSRDFEAELAELTTRRDALQADLDEFHSSSWLNRPWRRRLESE